MSVMEEKIDRLEHHFEVYKKDMVDVKDVLKDIKILLAGSTLNGNKGMVELINRIDCRVVEIEHKQILLEDSMNNFKWSIRTVFGAVVAVLIWFFTK